MRKKNGNRFSALLMAFVMVISLLPVSTLASASNLPDGLIGYYSFDGDFDNAVSGDSAAEVGTTTGSATGDPVAFADSNQGRGAKIGGSGSNGLLLDAAFSASTTTYTAAFWMKASSFTSYTSAIFFGTDSDNWVSFVPRIDGVCSLWSHDSSYHNNLKGPTMDTDTWYHIAFIRNGTTTTLYVNGAAVGSASDVADVVDAATKLYVGVNFWDTPFDGVIDELYVYDKAITAAELAEIYDGTTSISIKQIQLQDKIGDARNSLTSLSGDYSAASIAKYSALLTDIESKISASVTLSDIYALYDELEDAASVLSDKTYEYVGTTSLNSGLLAYYPLTSDTLDYSGGYDGTEKGAGASFDDGYLYLPGGAYGSGAGYVELPTGMFDTQNTLTISVWLKNETGSGNYSALFFGTTESWPVQYWLLNPKNTSGNFKSVITNTYDSGAPWNTEYGFSPTVSSQGITGPTTDSSWGLYTTVIQNGSITAYYNGALIGTVATTSTASDFGTDLVAYIGKSSYADMFYQGGVQDLRIYNKAITDDEAAALYNEVMVRKAADELDPGDLSSLRESFTLPNSFSSAPNVTVAWISNNSAITIANGNEAVVTRDSGVDTSGTLQAAISCGDYSVTVDFASTVLAGDDQADVDAAADEYVHDATAVWETINLPVSGNYGSSITWAVASNNYVTLSGSTLQVNSRPAVDEGNAAITLSATFTLSGKTATKTFEAEVLEEFYGYILGYTNTNTTDNDRTASLHLAYGQDQTSWTALNSDSGILYAQIETSDGTKNLSTGVAFANPYLYRQPDGSFGLVSAQKKNTNSIYSYSSDDLIRYEAMDMLAVANSGAYPKYVQVKYDYENQVYIINWSADGSVYYDSTTKDFTSIISTTAGTAPATSFILINGLTTSANAGNSIAVTKAEYDKLVLKLGGVYNTGVEEYDNVEVPTGTSESAAGLPETATLLYNDGGTYDLPVEWDTTNVNWNAAGEYEITGEIRQTQYDNPFIEQRADPNIYYDEETGYYYFTASYPAFGTVTSGYDRITLKQAKTIKGLATATEVTIWQAPSSGLHSAHIWAPEIHKINGEFYIFFAGGRMESIWAIRPYVLKANTGVSGSDVANASSWDQTPIACTSEQSAYFKNMSLDMTYFEHNGKHYVCWADIIGQSALYMQEIDPDQPWLGKGEVVMLTTPEFGWERDTERVNEGATIIRANGKLYMAFSASGTGSEYCIGMLYIDEDADIMDVDNWTKVSYPVLTSNDVPEEYGPGHNSFTVDEYGNAIFVYHARSEECYLGQCAWASYSSLYDPCRHARLKRVHYSGIDGMPILNMTYEEELASEYSAVSLKIVVSDDIPVVDKSELNTALEKYAEVYASPDEYTVDSYTVFKGAYESGKTVYNDSDATQGEVDSAVKAIVSAYEQMVKTDSSDDNSNPNSGSSSNSSSSSSSGSSSSPSSSYGSTSGTASGSVSSEDSDIDSSDDSDIDSSFESVNESGDSSVDSSGNASDVSSSSFTGQTSGSTAAGTGDTAVYTLFIVLMSSIAAAFVIRGRKRGTKRN